MSTIKIHFIWNNVETVFQVKETVTFNTIINHYLRQQGFSPSAVFSYNGINIDGGKSPKQLKFKTGARISVKNARFINTSRNKSVKVHVINKNGMICTRWYSVKPGTKCASLLSALRFELAETRRINMFCGENKLESDQIISDRPELIAYVYKNSSNVSVGN